MDGYLESPARVEVAQALHLASEHRRAGVHPGRDVEARCAAPQHTRAARYTPSFSRAIRLTSPPSARPLVSRITWPTIAPIADALPERIFSAASGLASIAACTMPSSSSPSPMAPRR